MIRSQRSPYGTSLLGAGAVHHIRLGRSGMSALSPFYPHVWTAPSWQGLSSPMQIGRCAHVFGLLRGSHDRWP